MNKKVNPKKLIATTICVCFTAGIILSALFALGHINHEHDCLRHDGGCAVCAQLEFSKGLLRFLCAALIGISLGIGCFVHREIILKSSDFRGYIFSLVSAKIRLNN
jgi:hypothetical protein